MIIVPSIVTFCPATYTFDNDDNQIEVCICMPLHEIHSHNADEIIMVKLNFQDSEVSGEDIFICY